MNSMENMSFAVLAKERKSRERSKIAEKSKKGQINEIESKYLSDKRNDFKKEHHNI